MSDKERPVCTATRRDGQPCRARAVVNGLCIGHQPPNPEWRRKGGRNSSKQARLDTMLPARLRPVLGLLEKGVKEVYDGSLEPKKAHAMASLAGAMVKVMEAGTFEERIQRLEERLEAKR
ncbi:hypothetical protein ACFLXE_06695 [Chloroflexota bacterium]